MNEHLLPGDTELHGLVRNHDWSQSPLGAMDTWPISLLTLVRTVLASRYPMILSWGPAYTQIYNDGYSQLIGDKHPADVGADLRQSLAEGWDVLGPFVESAKETGHATWIPQLPLLLERSGYREEAYFSVSHAPAPADDGSVGGMHAVCNEVTTQVLSERRLALLSALSVVSESSKDVAELSEIISATMSDYSLPLPFADLYLYNENGSLELAGKASASGLPMSTWQGVDAMNGHSGVVELGGEVLVKGGPFGDCVRHAIVMPVNPDRSATALGFIACGINPNRELDDAYRSFFDTLARQIAVALGNALAFQQAQKRTEALEQLDRVKTAFFSNMSHEMRTPMNAIVGGTTMLSDTELDDEQADLAAMINHSAEHLLSIINSALDYSRLDAGRLEFASEPIDVRNCVEAAVGLVSLSAVEKELRLTTSISESVPLYVIGDAARVRQILLNLVSNAVKFTDVGAVQVSVDYSVGNVHFTVTDTGIGMEEASLPHIFDAFSQVDKTVSTGTGLGLSITKSLVEGMGGRIGVQSVLGAGSTFSVLLPLEITGNAPKPAEVATFDRTFADRWPLRILIAEDHPVNQKVLVSMLSRLGYTPTVVDDGRKAVEAVTTSKYDLILMDVQMPVLDGLSATREIRSALQNGAQPRIFAVTANAMFEDRRASLAAGMDGHMAKPVTLSNLISILKGSDAATETHEPSGFEVLDSEVMNALAQHGPALLVQIIDTYLASAPELVDLTEAAVAEDRTDDARITLHRLKGSSATVGAVALARLCGRPVEEVTDLRAEYDRARRALIAERDRLTG